MLIENDQHVLEDEMVSKISEYANTQNKINKSDLLANTRFMSELERLSRNVWIPAQDGRKSDQNGILNVQEVSIWWILDVGKEGRNKVILKTIPKGKSVNKGRFSKTFYVVGGFPLYLK